MERAHVRERNPQIARDAERGDLSVAMAKRNEDHRVGATDHGVRAVVRAEQDHERHAAQIRWPTWCRRRRERLGGRRGDHDRCTRVELRLGEAVRVEFTAGQSCRRGRAEDGSQRLRGAVARASRDPQGHDQREDHDARTGQDRQQPTSALGRESHGRASTRQRPRLFRVLSNQALPRDPSTIEQADRALARGARVGYGRRHVSEARENVDEWVASGLTLQRGAAPSAELIERVRPWLEATLEALALLPPVGVVADLARLLAREPFDIAKSEPVAEPKLRAALDAYEEHVLGRLAADFRLENARDALLRLDEPLRPAAIAGVHRTGPRAGPSRPARG